MGYQYNRVRIFEEIFNSFRIICDFRIIKIIMIFSVSTRIANFQKLSTVLTIAKFISSVSFLHFISNLVPLNTFHILVILSSKSTPLFKSYTPASPTSYQYQFSAPSVHRKQSQYHLIQCQL